MTSSSRQPELPFSGGEPDNPPEAGDGPLVSLLSLKLLLLAFFILLNAMSELEALKVRAVLESVTKAFDGRLVVEENVARSAAAEGPLEGAEIFLKETGRIFNSLLPAVSRAESARSRSLIVELPIGTFFPEGERRLQAGRGLLLDRIAEHLKEPRHAELDYRLAIFHGQGERGGARDDLRIERAAVIAEGLVRRGLPAERLSVGLYPAALDSLRFEFQVGLWSSEADPEGDETP